MNDGVSAACYTGVGDGPCEQMEMPRNILTRISSSISNAAHTICARLVRKVWYIKHTFVVYLAIYTDISPKRWSYCCIQPATLSMKATAKASSDALPPSESNCSLRQHARAISLSRTPKKHLRYRYIWYSTYLCIRIYYKVRHHNASSVKRARHACAHFRNYYTVPHTRYHSLAPHRGCHRCDEHMKCAPLCIPGLANTHRS